MRTLAFAISLLFCLDALFAVETGNIGFVSIAVDDHTVTYRSGEHLMIEKMHADQWRCCYRSADDRFPIGLPDGDEVFYLKIGDKVLSDGWRLISINALSTSGESNQGVVVNLSNPDNAIDLSIFTTVDGTAIYTRWLEITNTSNKAIPLTEVSPWTGVLWPRKTPWGLDVGEYELGYFPLNTTLHPSGWGYEGWFTWETIQKNTPTTITSHQMRSHDDPFFILKNTFTGEYCIANLQWTTNWKLSFEIVDHGLSFHAGPCVTEGVLRVIDPGETVKTPALHMGLVSGTLDDAVQQMHTHVRRSVLPKRSKDRSLLVQYLVPSDQTFKMPFDENDVLKQVDLATAIGAELFILDFGWWDVTLDWQASPTRFPNGLEPLIEYVREKGMLFGLYVETEGGRGNVLQSKVAKEHPEWLTSSNVLNLSNPKAAAWMESEVCRLIDKYDVDLYRLDYNSGITGQFLFELTERGGFLENDCWRYYEAFSNSYERIKKKYPDVILQQAAAGGGRNDLGVVSLFDETYLTDGLWIPQEYLVYSGLTMALPPEIFATLHGAAPRKPFGHRLDGITRLLFATGTPQIFVGTTAPSLEEMQPKHLETFKRYVRRYKDFIRPLLPTCKVYHHEPINARGDICSSNFFAMEFSSPARDKGWALLMKTNRLSQKEKRPAVNGDDEYVFKPRGLDPSKRYTVTFDSIDTAIEIDGSRLFLDGLPVRLEDVGSSELLLFEAASTR